MNPSNKNLAEFYGLSRQTIASYKIKKKNLYIAMVEYYLRSNK